MNMPNCEAVLARARELRRYELLTIAGLDKAERGAFPALLRAEVLVWFAERGFGGQYRGLVDQAAAGNVRGGEAVNDEAGGQFALEREAAAGLHEYMRERTSGYDGEQSALFSRLLVTVLGIFFADGSDLSDTFRGLVDIAAGEVDAQGLPAV